MQTRCMRWARSPMPGIQPSAMREIRPSRILRPGRRPDTESGTRDLKPGTRTDSVLTGILRRVVRSFSWTFCSEAAP
jgi:hypothetical protein